MARHFKVNLMNYFDWFDLPLAFVLDEKELKRKFIAKSRSLHPDFFTQGSDEEQADALEQSTFNNQAYRTLKKEDARMKYILDLKEILAEEGQNKLPQAFLMEMMEINEGLMELEFDYDETAFQKTKSDIENLESSLYNEIKTILEDYKEEKEQASELIEVKKYYLKRKYILRIKENLNKFASA